MLAAVARTLLVAALALAPAGCARTTAADAPRMGAADVDDASAGGVPAWVWLAVGAAAMIALVAATADVDEPKRNYTPTD